MRAVECVAECGSEVQNKCAQEKRFGGAVLANSLREKKLLVVFYSYTKLDDF